MSVKHLSDYSKDILEKLQGHKSGDIAEILNLNGIASLVIQRTETFDDKNWMRITSLRRDFGETRIYVGKIDNLDRYIIVNIEENKMSEFLAWKERLQELSPRIEKAIQSFNNVPEEDYSIQFLEKKIQSLEELSRHLEEVRVKFSSLRNLGKIIELQEYQECCQSCEKWRQMLQQTISDRRKIVQRMKDRKTTMDKRIYKYIQLIIIFCCFSLNYIRKLFNITIIFETKFRKLIRCILCLSILFFLSFNLFPTFNVI
jgi:hypothetical protein